MSCSASVQFRRDPGALVAHRQLGVGPTLLREVQGKVGEAGGDDLALSEGSSCSPGGGRYEEERNDLVVAEGNGELGDWGPARHSKRFRAIRRESTVLVTRRRTKPKRRR